MSGECWAWVDQALFGGVVGTTVATHVIRRRCERPRGHAGDHAVWTEDGWFAFEKPWRP